jgi:hypothetical protein
MPEDRLNPQQSNDNNVEGTENKEENTGERFLSDTQKIVRRHLENENDVITDEDIRNVRDGMTPPHLDAPTQARIGDEEIKDEVEEEYLDTKQDKNEPEANKGDKVTPWDTIEPSE